MALTPVLLSRVTNELNMLIKSPPPGVSCWPVGDSMIEFEAVIIGADGTPYDKGEFKLSMTLPLRYPMEPPRCLFKTKIWHPNVDEGGRICLDILNLPPKGSWKPSLNMSTVLTSLRLLLSNPNPEDPLVGHISDQYVADYESFARTAKSYTQKYASTHSSGENAPSAAESETSVGEEPSAPPPAPPSYEPAEVSSNTPNSAISPSQNEKKRKNGANLDSPIDPISTDDTVAVSLPEAKRPKIEEVDENQTVQNAAKKEPVQPEPSSSSPVASIDPKPLSVAPAPRPAAPKKGVSLGFTKK